MSARATWPNNFRRLIRTVRRRTSKFVTHSDQVMFRIRRRHHWSKASILFSIALGMLTINPLDSKGNYSATSNNAKLVHWPLMGGLLHLVHRGGAWAGCRSLLAVPHVTAHPSTASEPITVLLYDGPLLCGFNLAIKELKIITLAIHKYTGDRPTPQDKSLGQTPLLCCRTWVG